MEQILAGCPLFKGAEFVMIEELLSQYPHKTRQFREKDFVLLQNDICDHLMILLNGRLQAQMVDSSGKLMIVDEFGAGEVLAPAFLFSAESRMPVSLFALENAEVLYFKKQVFMQILQANETILVNYLQIISNKTKFLSERLNFHAFKSIKSKIAHYLLEQYKSQDSLYLRLGLTQQELSDRFGVTRPSLSRSLAEMEKEGMIHVKGKEIKILDLILLKRLV